MLDIRRLSLLRALSAMFGMNVADAEYASEVLHGGTVGEVCRVSGDGVDRRWRSTFLARLEEPAEVGSAIATPVVGGGSMTSFGLEIRQTPRATGPATRLSSAHATTFAF